VALQGQVVVLGTREPQQSATTEIRMAEPTRDEIKPRVIGVIANVSGFDPKTIKEEQSLAGDLGLSEYQRASLAPGVTEIARNCNAHATIAASTCKKLETVKDAIDLVFKKAGGS